ncbi:uncharacterized protein LOC112901378 isoform X2 [Panicum hallii]|uniref:uncharacterized protein LOC112901378 isoform X2 n=1 Tax=Panicum hallii TaxID=206008 RepID=UPI000DF4DFFC|nr:uncharacterized protein LOC112901378 isoform X2 [Panicum hallii]
MGTGWRRALCTSVQWDDGGDGHRDAKNKKRRPQHTPTAGAGGGFFSAGGGFFSAVKSAATGGGSSSSSNPSTPTLRCRTKPLQQPAEPASVTPPSAPAPMGKHRMPLLQALSAPASRRSPSRFALLKASLLPSKGTSEDVFSFEDDSVEEGEELEKPKAVKRVAENAFKTLPCDREAKITMPYGQKPGARRKRLQMDVLNVSIVRTACCHHYQPPNHQHGYQQGGSQQVKAPGHQQDSKW